MEYRREFKEAEIVDEGEDQESPEVHRGVLSDTTPQTRGQPLLSLRIISYFSFEIGKNDLGCPHFSVGR